MTCNHTISNTLRNNCQQQGGIIVLLAGLVMGMVGWSWTSLFSTNATISETTVMGNLVPIHSSIKNITTQHSKTAVMTRHINRHLYNITAPSLESASVRLTATQWCTPRSPRNYQRGPDTRPSRRRLSFFPVSSCAACPPAGHVV